MRSVTRTELPGFECLHRGKVRDVWRVDAEHLLLVATDRFSAFDVVFEQPIPGKGIILTQISIFWFEELKDLVRHHVVATDVADFPQALRAHADPLRGRSLLVRSVRIHPFECIVRGQLLGSGWAAYKKTGAIVDQRLPPGLTAGARLDPPLFTPSTKAPAGEHDELVPFHALEARLGIATARALKEQSVAVFERGRQRAAQAGLVLCDTKLEWGDLAGTLVLADEVLTPDSSRYWRHEDLAAAATGASPPSFDKQVVRDWLLSTDWNQKAPGPRIPEAVLAEARDRYILIHDRLVGRPLQAFDDRMKAES